MLVACAALATGVDTTENNPAVSADTATTAMRFLSVFVDICFLSLVELGNFPISARRSFDPLILFLMWHTRVMPQKRQKVSCSLHSPDQGL